MGGSYLGWTQLLPASLNNPALKAMIPMVTPPDPGGYWPQRDGAVALALLEWALVVEGRTLRSFGEAKRDLIPETSPEDALNQQIPLKCAFDPSSLLNPGKMFPVLHRCAELGRVHVHHGETRFPDIPRF